MRAYEKKTDGRRKKKFILLWNNVETREMKSSLFHEKISLTGKWRRIKKSSYGIFNKRHPYIWVSICVTESQTEPDLNHFWSLKGGFIFKWHPGKIPHKELCNSWFCQNQDVTVIILQLASYIYMCICVCINISEVQYWQTIVRI